MLHVYCTRVYTREQRYHALSHARRRAHRRLKRTPPVQEYTLDHNQAHREAEAILETVGTSRGWRSAQHFVIHSDELFWTPEKTLKPGKTFGYTKWTERQRDVHKEIVEGYLVLKEAFRLHQLALDNRNEDAITFTFDQLRTVTFSAFAGAMERMQPITTASTKLQRAGKTGGRPALDQDALYRDYDQWLAQGVARPLIITRLSTNYARVKASIRRILREGGRGPK